MWDRKSQVVVWMAVVVALVGASCGAKETHRVTLSYVVVPERPLPEGLRTVAVIDSGVTTQGAQQAEREQKWSGIAADMIEAMLQQGSYYGSPLQVAMRRETQKVLQEQDLRLAGLVDGESAAQAGRLLAVEGLIASRITITMDVQRSTRSTVDWMSILGEFAGSTREPDRVRPERQTVPRSVRVYRAPRYTRDSREAYVHDPRIHPSSPYYPYGRPPYRDPRHPQPVPPPVPVAPSRSGGRAQFTLRTREVEEISRHLTVTCSFSLIDAVTGQALMQYSPPPYRKTDKVSPNFLFGGLIDEADLDPVDHFIGELVERATQEFASMLVPARVEVSYELVGRQTRSEEGIRALRADDYEGAMRSFQEELAKRPDSDEVVFAMGVTSELMGDPEQALAYYRQALGMRKVDEDWLPIYEAARNRLVAHIGRILQPESGAVWRVDDGREAQEQPLPTTQQTQAEQGEAAVEPRPHAESQPVRWFLPAKSD